MSQYAMDGEMISMRGYPNQSLSSQNGSTIYNKFSLNRYPITLKPAASIFGLTLSNPVKVLINFVITIHLIQRSMGVRFKIFMPAFGLLGIDFGYGLMVLM